MHVVGKGGHARGEDGGVDGHRAVGHARERPAVVDREQAEARIAQAGRDEAVSYVAQKRLVYITRKTVPRAPAKKRSAKAIIQRSGARQEGGGSEQNAAISHAHEATHGALWIE